MRQDLETGKVAANLMNQFINAGMIKQTGQREVVVPGPDGEKTFVAYEND